MNNNLVNCIIRGIGAYLAVILLYAGKMKVKGFLSSCSFNSTGLRVQNGRI